MTSGSAARRPLALLVSAGLIATTVAGCPGSGDQAPASGIFLVEQYPSGGNTVYRKAIEGAASVSSGQVVDVSGVGDEAGYVARAQTLCVHQGTKNLCLVGGAEPALTALARKALTRM